LFFSPRRRRRGCGSWCAARSIWTSGSDVWSSRFFTRTARSCGYRMQRLPVAVVTPRITLATGRL
jgi:hypothetical protein